MNKANLLEIRPGMTIVDQRGQKLPRHAETGEINATVEWFLRTLSIISTPDQKRIVQSVLQKHLAENKKPVENGDGFPPDQTENPTGKDTDPVDVDEDGD